MFCSISGITEVLTRISLTGILPQNHKILDSMVINIFFAHQKSALFTNGLLIISSNFLDGLNIFWTTQKKCDLLKRQSLECKLLLCFVFREPEPLSPYSHLFAPSVPHHLVHLYLHLVQWSASFGGVSVCTFTHLVQWRQFAHFVQKTFGALVSICTFEAVPICTPLPCTAHRWQTSYL